MKFKFEYLQPKTEVIQIIECYETLGYKPCFDTGNFSEEVQWSDDTEVITIFLTHSEKNSITLHLPKLFFEKRIEYKDWMPREEFEKLCKQDASYYYSDCVLATELYIFTHKPNGCDFKVSKDLHSLALGFFNRENAWEFSGGVFSDTSKYKYVKIIKREQE